MVGVLKARARVAPTWIEVTGGEFPIGQAAEQLDASSVVRHEVEYSPMLLLL